MPSDAPPVPEARFQNGAGGLPETSESRPTCPGIPPGIRQSQEAFRRALPQLLQSRKHHRKWVAYCGDVCIGFAATDTALYEECLRRGLNEEEFVVRCIVPEMPWDLDATPLGEV